MVDVRMREDDRVQPARGKLLRRERKVRVDVGCLLATALVEAAVQQHVLPRAFDVVARPGDSLLPHPRNANELPCVLLCFRRAAGKSLHRAPLPFKSHEQR